MTIHALRSTASRLDPSTLTDLLHWRAAQHPNRLAYTFLKDGESDEVSVTYGELDRQARAIGALLQSTGATGERVLLLYPSGIEYIAAFFGCLYAGAVAVPAYPPRLNRSLDRIKAVVVDAQATTALTTTTFSSKTACWFAQAPELATLRWLDTDSIAHGMEETWQEPAIDRDTLAFSQYTSGSTGTPKGVMLSHGNLLHNVEMIQKAFQQTEQSVGVSWLPLYHDMGLIGSLLEPLYVGFPCVLMPPTAFLQRPLRWLQAISRYKATGSGGPNFAYDLCVRKITPAQLATLDLSSWEVAFNGAEPVRQATLERFTAAFAPCGFRREAFYPCYGLAEATLIVSGGLKSAPPVTYTIQKSVLEQYRVAIPCIGNKGAQTLVGCGRALSAQQTILIVDPETHTACPPDRVGEIWVAGPSIALGYWNHAQETTQTFQAYLADTGKGPFLRTGDLGFLHHGELFITGRIKDVIIVRGSNHYPQDIELTVEQSHPSLRPGCGAAFAAEMAGEERLVIVQEVERRYQPQRRQRPERRKMDIAPSFEPEPPQPLDVETVVGNIRQAVAENHGVQAYAVLLLRAGSIPKTSSGKIQRYACRAGFLSESLEVVGEWHATLTSEQAVLGAAAVQRHSRQLTSREEGERAAHIYGLGALQHGRLAVHRQCAA